MAKVPDLKRLTTEDFSSEDRDLVGKIGFVINSFHEQVRNVLNKGVDFENLAQEVKTLSFTTGSTGQPLNTLTFKSGLINKVQGILPIRTVITSSNTSFQAQMPVISWSQNGTTITILYIGGLNPETKYDLTILTL